MPKVIKKGHIRNYVELWVSDSEFEDWTFAPGEEFLNEVNEWVKDTELGYRNSYNGWKLRSPDAVTAFYLKWNSDT